MTTWTKLKASIIKPADATCRGRQWRISVMAPLENVKDPEEIDLDGPEDESASKDDGAGGDSVCFSPPSNVAKRPRTENA